MLLTTLAHLYSLACWFVEMSNPFEDFLTAKAHACPPAGLVS